MTEWEKLKKEYKELPIPTNGPHQVLEAIRLAEKKKNRWKTATRYGTAAAAVCVLLLLPAGLWLNGGFQSADNYCEDFVVAESASENMSMSFTGKAGGTTAKEEPLQAGEEYGCAADGQYDNGASADAADNLYIMSDAMDTALWTEYKEAISKEIVRQMKERMQDNEGTYYVKSEAYPEGFELLSEEQSCYINEAGLFVFVFEAGTVAPEEQGAEEFIIPKEVAAP